MNSLASLEIPAPIEGEWSVDVDEGNVWALPSGPREPGFLLPGDRLVRPVRFVAVGGAVEVLVAETVEQADAPRRLSLVPVGQVPYMQPFPDGDPYWGLQVLIHHRKGGNKERELGYRILGVAPAKAGEQYPCASIVFGTQEGHVGDYLDSQGRDIRTLYTRALHLGSVTLDGTVEYLTTIKDEASRTPKNFPIEPSLSSAIA